MTNRSAAAAKGPLQGKSLTSRPRFLQIAPRSSRVVDPWSSIQRIGRLGIRHLGQLVGQSSQRRRDAMPHQSTPGQCGSGPASRGYRKSLGHLQSFHHGVHQPDAAGPRQAVSCHMGAGEDTDMVLSSTLCTPMTDHDCVPFEAPKQKVPSICFEFLVEQCWNHMLNMQVSCTLAMAATLAHPLNERDPCTNVRVKGQGVAILSGCRYSTDARRSLRNAANAGSSMKRPSSSSSSFLALKTFG